MIRVDILGVEKLGTSEVRFGVVVYRSDDGMTWTQIPGSPQYVVFQATEVLTITNDTGLTNEQKLGALVALMQAQITDCGVTDSEEAIGDLAALGITYPVTINL